MPSAKPGLVIDQRKRRGPVRKIQIDQPERSRALPVRQMTRRRLVND
jgi:hypothetical protein